MEMDSSNSYSIKVKLFERWLIEVGVNIIIIDQLGDELEDAQREADKDLYVKPAEIIALVEKWPLYRGEKISSEDVRGWLQQEKKLENQRFLFTILQNIRFPNDLEINSMLNSAHDSLKKDFSGFVQTHKLNKRSDLLVTYADGVGKSGAFYSTRYCQENKLSIQNNCEISNIRKELGRRKSQSESLRGIVIIDDFMGTGNSISSDLEKFISDNRDILDELNVPVRVIILFSTLEAEKKFRSSIHSIGYDNIDLYVCEVIDDSHYAFPESKSNFWKSVEDKNNAKALCHKHGKILSKNAPLGYKNQGMLFVLPRNCPNNTLTLLHMDESKEEYSWKSLFPRLKA